MRKVERSEIVDYATYDEDVRPELRPEVMALKRPRRVHLGPHLTFLFENRDTVRYQVQEMMRAERIVKEADILHELETYNELLGDDGELGCTLLIEIEEPEDRDRLLKEWLPLMDHLYALLEDGTRVPASYDPRQVGEDRLSSVQYLKLDTNGAAPTALGCDLEGYRHEVELTDEQRAALASDLAS